MIFTYSIAERDVERSSRMKIEQNVIQLMGEAEKRGVNDIHLLPRENKYQIYFRVSGHLVEHSVVSLKKGAQLIAYLKFLSNMDVGEKRFPQSGAKNMLINGSNKSVRFSTITDFLHQESLVIRFLNQTQKRKLVQTCYFPNQVTVLKQLIEVKSGLILFSGPVGSGKTTTMFQLIKEFVGKENCQVFTIEDPVEIQETLFLQTQVNPKAGIGYDLLIKASLRHHPDIIVVGEIRDQETAKMVIRAALTGHLIVSSIHAKNGEGVVKRLLELGVSAQQIKQSLIGVISQKLVPQYCPFCQGECHLYCSFLAVYAKRSVIYETLTGRELEGLMEGGDAQINLEKQTKSFNYYLRKAYSYGFITKKSYRQYKIQ